MCGRYTINSVKYCRTFGFRVPRECISFSLIQHQILIANKNHRPSKYLIYDFVFKRSPLEIVAAIVTEIGLSSAGEKALCYPHMLLSASTVNERHPPIIPHKYSQSNHPFEHNPNDVEHAEEQKPKKSSASFFHRQLNLVASTSRTSRINRHIFAPLSILLYIILSYFVAFVNTFCDFIL